MSDHLVLQPGAHATAEVIDHPLRFKMALHAAAAEAGMIAAPTVICSQSQMDKLLEDINRAHGRRLDSVYADGYRDGVRDGRKDEAAETPHKTTEIYNTGVADGRASARWSYRALACAAVLFVAALAVIVGFGL